MSDGSAIESANLGQGSEASLMPKPEAKEDQVFPQEGSPPPPENKQETTMSAVPVATGAPTEKAPGADDIITQKSKKISALMAEAQIDLKSDENKRIGKLLESIYGNGDGDRYLFHQRTIEIKNIAENLKSATEEESIKEDQQIIRGLLREEGVEYDSMLEPFTDGIIGEKPDPRSVRNFYDKVLEIAIRLEDPERKLHWEKNSREDNLSAIKKALLADILAKKAAQVKAQPESVEAGVPGEQIPTSSENTLIAPEPTATIPPTTHQDVQIEESPPTPAPISEIEPGRLRRVVRYIGNFSRQIPSSVSRTAPATEKVFSTVEKTFLSSSTTIPTSSTTFFPTETKIKQPPPITSTPDTTTPPESTMPRSAFEEASIQAPAITPQPSVETPPDTLTEDQGKAEKAETLESYFDSISVAANKESHQKVIQELGEIYKLKDEIKYLKEKLKFEGKASQEDRDTIKTLNLEGYDQTLEELTGITSEHPEINTIKKFEGLALQVTNSLEEKNSWNKEAHENNLFAIRKALLAEIIAKTSPEPAISKSVNEEVPAPAATQSPTATPATPTEEGVISAPTAEEVLIPTPTVTLNATHETQEAEETSEAPVTEIVPRETLEIQTSKETPPAEAAQVEAPPEGTETVVLGRQAEIPGAEEGSSDATEEETLTRRAQRIEGINKYMDSEDPENPNNSTYRENLMTYVKGHQEYENILQQLVNSTRSGFNDEALDYFFALIEDISADIEKEHPAWEGDHDDHLSNVEVSVLLEIMAQQRKKPSAGESTSNRTESSSTATEEEESQNPPTQAERASLA